MFSDITKQPQLQISRQGMDVKLIESRVKFLKRAVSSAVQLIEKTVNQVILAFFYMYIFNFNIIYFDGFQSFLFEKDYPLVILCHGGSCKKIIVHNPRLISWY